MDSEEAEGKEAPDMAPCVPVRLSSPSAESGPPGVGLSQHAPSCPLSVHFRPDLEPTGRGIHTGLSRPAGGGQGTCDRLGPCPGVEKVPGALQVAGRHSPWTRSTRPPGSLGKALVFNPPGLRRSVFLSLNFNLKGQRNLIFLFAFHPRKFKTEGLFLG